MPSVKSDYEAFGGRSVPFSAEAEQSVLGAMLIDGDAVNLA